MTHSSNTVKHGGPTLRPLGQKMWYGKQTTSVINIAEKQKQRLQNAAPVQ